MRTVSANFVQLAEVNIGEDRRNHAALRNAAQRVMVFPVFQVPGFQHVTHKPQESVIVDLL
jgi:hypothetical protein